MWLHPRDDLYDAHGVLIGLLHIVLAPIVGIVSFLLARRAEMARQRKHPRICNGCGYDLTGMTRAECPECGRRIPEVP